MKAFFSVTQRGVAALLGAVACQWAHAQEAPSTELGTVTVYGPRATSLPTQIPATVEGVNQQQIADSVNARDSEDALKYLPSLLVRKRYDGDYNHAVLSSRASGTGNSARSAVYADGMLLSNYLGNGVGALSFAPRWGMVTPYEIERVDVMYGPFSAAYPGNSVGAVVDYVTRMPKAFEGYASVGAVVQPFSLYGVQETFKTQQASAALGSRAGAWSWWLNVQHSDAQGQPLTFATRLLSAGTPTQPSAANVTPVTGAVLGANNANQPWLLLGTGTAYRSAQEHAKLKLAFDVAPTLRATYTLGYWQNTTTSQAMSLLRNASGQIVANGAFSTQGLTFSGAQALSGADFAQTQESQTHLMHGLSLKSHTKGVWDWELAASLYQYQTDQKRQNGATNPWPSATGAGTVADGAGSGWHNLAAKGIWRPQGVGGLRGDHIVDFGYQYDAYQLRYATFNLPTAWRDEAALASHLANEVRGRTQLHSLYAQDAWAFAPRWKTVLGLRAEQWAATDGNTAFSASSATPYAARLARYLSPKAALSHQWSSDTVLKMAVGRAVRMPTVAELYGATSTSNSQYINDPHLQPEKSWTGEITAQHTLGSMMGDLSLRATLFAEDTRDALYSQTLFDPAALKNITRVQNVGRIATRGAEWAVKGEDVLLRGLDLAGSVTYAQSIIKDNAGFVVLPGDTLGRQQPNVPRWRANAVATYRWRPDWSAALGLRHSGSQFRTLNNSDVNGATYQGVSPFTVLDLRLRHRLNRQLTAAFGIDNVTNASYWNFHPYPQRSFVFELKAAL